jgi:hypothetical protein
MKFVRALLVAMIAIAVSATPGCPQLPPPDGCTPSAMRCHNDVPEVCSPSTRWTPADRPCAQLGGVCCPTQSPYGHVVHACVPQDRCLPEEPIPDDAAAHVDGGAQ